VRKEKEVIFMSLGYVGDHGSLGSGLDDKI
jgi:hypothetical protein